MGVLAVLDNQRFWRSLARTGHATPSAPSPFSKPFWIAAFRNTTQPATFEKAGGEQQRYTQRHRIFARVFRWFYSLAANVSRILCWRAERDDGEHSSR
jgi:hypothetical protein